jgi:P4 family phage/plasmid primase-like protien
LNYDIQAVRDAASTRWPEIIAQIAGLDPAILDGKHHPCPKCGGTDRFRAFNDGSGGVICNQCFTTRNGDGFAVLQWLTGDDFKMSLNRTAEYLGIQPSKNGKPNPDDHLQFEDWDDMLVSLWCLRYEPITPQAVQAVGGRIARYRKQWTVLAWPVREPGGDKVRGWVIQNITGGTLPTYSKDGAVEWVKKKTLPGTQPGLIGTNNGKQKIIKTEGPTDLLAFISQGLADDEDAVCNVHGCGEDPRKVPGLAAYLESKDVVTVHDADEPGQEGARGRGDRPGWATFAAAHAKSSRLVQLPYPITGTKGKDLRDFFRDGYTRANFDDLAARAELLEHHEIAAIESEDDPHRLARENLRRYASRFDGATIRNWRDEWYVWKKNRYRKIPPGELEAKICLSVKQQFDQLNIAEQANPDAERVKATRKVTQALTRNVMAATRSMVVLPSHIELGTWIDATTGAREPRPLIALQNGILDLEQLLGGIDDPLVEHSPQWFSTTCLPYAFNPDATCPRWDEFLLRNLEGDQDRIRLLQEWAGYLLLADTGQQKFLVLEGEGANGKSVYMAAIEAMLGSDNCSHVPLEVFGDRFSRTQSLGKLCNIASDVGELDRPAEGHLKSFTSGEKMFFDRKGIAGIDAYPTARLMLACNNRPRFSDKSEGVWRRMILVPFRVQIPRHERIQNMDKPWWWERSGELPGVLLWAIRGLYRLRQQGEFTEPQICREALADYRTENNPAKQFFDEKTEPAEKNVSVQCAELYDRYKRWCADNGFRPLSSRVFGREIYRHYPGISRKQSGRVWHYFGISNVFDGGTWS